MKLQRFVQCLHDGTADGEVWVFWCPGCKQHHMFNTLRERRPLWTFNGDRERPTFEPSLLYPDKTVRCHLYLRDGKIQFLSDCGHELAGKTVDLDHIPEEYLWQGGE
jgi:hypothetical protein